MSMRNNNTPLISVIIPVWNPGPGITRCIESLRNQTLQEIEMIFVDDCGTDDSMELVLAAAAEDARLRIIRNEENIGPGPSRNKGIETARGKYLSFVDPDDYVALDFLELLYSKTQNQAFDIVKGSIVRERMDGSLLEDEEKTNTKIRRKLSMGIPLISSFTYEHQSAIYRHELIRSANVRYGLSRRGEDSTFLLQICSQAKSFSIVEAARYHYCQHLEGIIHTVDASMLSALLQSVHEQVDYALRGISRDDWVKKYMENRFLYVLKELGKFYDNPILETTFSDTMKRLRNEWIRLPFHIDSARNFFPLYAMQEHGCLLPLQPFYSWESASLPARYAKLVKRWVDYYLNYPKESNACRKDLINIAVRAKMAVRRRPYTMYNKEERKKKKKILKNQLNRLPCRLQIAIIIFSMKSFLFRLLPGRVLQGIKKLRK